MPETADRDRSTGQTILYCRCAYAEVVANEVKDAVLKDLLATGRPFEAVADLCEMSARRDERLKELAGRSRLRIAACYPRAVRNLFRAAGAELDEGAQIANMRIDPADQIVELLVEGRARPATDDGKERR